MSEETIIRTAVVTGGSRGIGRAVCIQLAKQGCNVVVNYCHGEAAAAETVALCKAENANAVAVQADVSTAEGCKALFEQAVNAFGRVDILVNNAGITRDNLILRMSEEDFDAVLNANLKGAFLCCKEAARRMVRQRWGRIVNLSSVVALRGNAGQTNYAASKAGLIGLIRKAKGAEKLLIPVLFVLFSLGGAVFGMGEEALPFTMILCPLFVAVGYDTVIAVLVTYVATQIGFGSSWMNPFSVGIAQGIAGIDVFSGAGFRMVMWVVFTALGCGMTMFYAAKVKKTPEISVAYESDQYFRDQNEKTGIDEGHSFGIGHILVLVTLAVTVVWVIWGVMAKGYYMAEIATQFFIMGIVAGVIGVIFHLNDMKVNDIAVSFKDGAKDLIGAALVVAMAQGIMQVLGGSDPTTPTVINTIMYGISQALAGLSGAAAAVLMYVFQSVFNFFVVSGSGQAAITMPIMAPLADLLGVSRQTSVLAFQLGDAFTNLIVPTSGCLIGSLAIAKIEWSNWIKFMWKFLGILMIGAVITILIAVAIGF